jgi:nitrate/nitrite-specific signal transduction histidine kinase
VRDDGAGIDPAILSAGGREGHFGLSGMRERAKLSGGTLTLWSAIDVGTVVELTIPASHAYSTVTSGAWPSKFWRTLFRQTRANDS